jgi:hypothetical protein
VSRRQPWKDEIGYAETICAPLGMAVAQSAHQYEIATVKGDGVQLVIYPHKTTAGHHHARVRDNGSKDKARARHVLHALETGEGLPEDIRWKVQFTCTFTVKNYPTP